MSKNTSVRVSLNVDANVDSARKSLNSLQDSLRRIQTERIEIIDDIALKNASKAASDLQRHLQASVNVDTGKIDLARFSQSLKQSGQNLEHFYNSFKVMGSAGEQAFLNLSKSIALSDAGMIRLGGRLDDFLKTLAKTAKWQISSNIFTGFEKVLSSAYGYAKDLNRSLNEIRIVSGQNTDQMAKFAKEANRAARALSSSTTDYTDAALIYYQQGLQEEEIAERTEVTIKMANAAGESAQTVSDQMTAVWNNFYDGSKSLEYYADVMTALGAATASSTDEISDGLEKFAATAGTVGLSYEYATTALATVTAETRQSADVVGTAFRTLFTRIQGLQLGKTAEDGTTLNKYSAALDAVGVNIKNASGELKGMDQILAELGDRWGKLSQDTRIALAQTVGGARQYTTLISLMDNWDKFQKNLDVTNTAEGTLQEQADIYAESWEAASERVGAAAEEIYSKLLNDEFFIDILNGFEKFLGGISNVVDGLGGMKGMLLAISTIIMRRYAKEIPGVLSNIGANLGLITGKAKEEAKDIQNQNAKYLDNIIGTKGSEALKENATTIKQINSMNQQLAENWDNLTESERSFYQEKISIVEAIGSEIQKTIKEIKDLDKEINSQERFIQQSYIENGDQQVGFAEFKKSSETRGQLFGYASQLSAQSTQWKESKKYNFDQRKESMKSYADALKKWAEKDGQYRDIEKGFKKDSKVDKAKKELEKATKENLQERWEAYQKAVEEVFAKATKVLNDQVNESRAKVANGVSNIEGLYEALDEYGLNLESRGNLVADKEGFTRAKKLVSDEKPKHITKNAEVYSYYASQVMQAAFSVQSFTQTIKVLEDENADLSDKLISSATSLGSISGFIRQLGSESNIKQLANMAMGLEKFSKIGTDSQEVLDKMAATGAMTTGSFKALSSTLGPLLAQFALVAAAIAAVAVVLKIGYEQAHKEELAAKRLAEAYEETTRTVKELNEEHQKLQNTISNYKDSKKALSEMARGTDEWRKKVSELNAESLELLNNNKKLFENSEYYSQDNGVLTITEAGLQFLEEKSQKRINDNLKTQYAQASGLATQQILGEKEDFQYLFATQQNTSGLSDDQLNALLNLYNKNPEYFGDIRANSGTILDTLGVNSNSVLGQQIITILERNLDTLAELNLTITENTIAAETYNEQLGHQILEEDENYKSKSDEEKDIIASFVGKRVSEEALEKYKKNSENFWASFYTGEYQRDKKIQEEYAKLIGADGFEDLKDNKARYRINGVWKEIDDATARYAIALDKASKSTTDYANLINNILYKNGTYIGVTGNQQIDNALLSGGSGQIGNLSSLSEEDLKGLANGTITINIGDNDAIELGWENKDDYINAVKQQAQGELDKRTAIRNNQKDEFYTNLDEKIGINTTSSNYDAPGDTLGGSSSTGFYEYLEAIGLDPQKFLEKYSHDENAPEWADNKSYWEKQADEILKLVQIEERAVQKNEELKTQIEQFDLKEEEIESYAKHLQEIATTSEKVADGLKEDAVTAKEVAISATRLNRGLDTLQENLIDWEKILNREGLDKSSKDYADTVIKLKEATADVLNIDSNELTEDFVVKHFEDIKLAAQGDIEAIEKLQQVYSEGYVDQLKTVVGTNEQFAKNLNGLSSEIANFAKENNIEVGASVDLDATGFVETLNAMIEQVPESKAIIEDLLESLGYSVIVGEKSIETLVYLGSITDKINYSNTKAGGAKLKNSGADKTKKLDEELDRYHEIKEVLEDINREQDRLGKAKDRAWGGKRIALIQQEIDKTEEAIAAQEEYIRQIEAQAGTSKGAIAAYGATFDEYGRITNYSELIAQQVAIYNAAIASGVDSQIEAAEKAYEAFKKALSDYEETADLLEEEYENLIDKQNELYDKLLEKVEYTVEVKLEVSGRDQAYLDYLIEKGSSNAYNTAENIALIGDKTQDLINDGNTYRQGIEDIFGNHGKDDDFIQQWLAGKISNEDLINLGFTEQEIAKLQEYADGLLEVNTKLMELKNTITEMIISAFQDLAEEMQRNIDKISHLKDVMNSYKNIIDLVGKQNLGIDSKFMGDINQAIFDTSANSLRANKAKLDATRDAYQDVYDMAQTANAKWQEAQANSENYTEAELDELEATAAAFNDSLSEMETEVQNAEQAFLTSWQDALQAAADMYNQAVENAISDFEDTMSAGFGSLDSLLEVYEQSKTISSQYLEEYQQIYELSKLTRNINNSIDDTDNIAGKEKLRDLLFEIEEMQRNGVEMSQYDLEYLQKRYDLRLAEIALEDAQNAKSQVRMVRDAEGNWNYTYTADDSAVDNARQNYEDKLYALQQLSSEYLDTIGQQWIQAEKEWAQALQAIYLDTTLTEEERKNRIEQTNEFYRQRFQYFTGEIEKATGNNQKLYERDWMAYSAKTGYQIADNESFQMSFNDTILGTIYDGVNSIEELHSNLNTAMGAPGIEGSLLGTLDSSYKQWSANVDFAMDMAGTSVGDFAGAVKGMAGTVATDGEQAAKNVEGQGKRVGDTFNGIKTAVDTWLTAYSTSIASAIAENEKLVTSIQKIATAYLAALKAQDSFNGSNTGGGSGGGTPDNSTPKPGDSFGSGGGGSSNRMCLFTITADPHDAEVYINGEPSNAKSVKQGETVHWRVSKPGYKTKQDSIVMTKDHYEHVTLDKNSLSGGYRNSNQTPLPFDTGGYTGEWGSSGRIAMLHQKELVLNPPDTKNMLQTIGIVREIARSIDLNAISASQGLGGLIAQTLHSSNQTLDQQVTIYAEFPNAVDHTEIEEAFNTLVNTASQYANRKL